MKLCYPKDTISPQWPTPIKSKRFIYTLHSTQCHPSFRKVGSTVLTAIDLKVNVRLFVLKF
jgi:hypothetical protein